MTFSVVAYKTSVGGRKLDLLVLDRLDRVWIRLFPGSGIYQCRPSTNSKHKRYKRFVRFAYSCSPEKQPLDLDYPIIISVVPPSGQTLYFQITTDRLTVSSDLLNVGGVCLQGGVAFSGGETLLIGAVLMMTMVMMRKAAAVSVAGGRPR